MGLVLGTCQNRATEQSISTTPTEQPVVTSQEFPGMSQEQLVDLFQRTDEMDILFLEKSFSMNAPGNMAKSQIGYISPVAAPKTQCTEICYLFVKSQGEQIAHIGAYLGDGCSYYVFYENSKPVYVNGMTKGGIDFFNNVLAQVKTSPQ